MHKWTVLVVALSASVFSSCVTTEERPARSTEELLAARQADEESRANEWHELSKKFLVRLAAKAKTKGTEPPTINVLVISGGGDRGAFGAGVLKGWGRVKGDLARPEFDAVTGVSAGALIAPFAFLGDEQSIERIVQLYRNPQADTAVSRGLLFFLPSKASFFTSPGLEREVRAALDRGMLERLAAEIPTGRMLLINTTNLDFGSSRAWDLLEESRVALARNDEGHLHNIMLASASMPGILPARTIGDYLYADGAITGNILYYFQDETESTERLPRSSLPRVRYWVIYNNQLRFPPQAMQEKWPNIVGRAVALSNQNSTITAIRHLYARIEIARLKYQIGAQVLLISIPNDWVPSKDDAFDKDTMNELADIGERMGADPTSWRTEAP